jgi:hypothetical protein
MILALVVLFFIMFSSSVSCMARDEVPTVYVRTFVRNVEKIDLSESTFRIDFYLIINFDPSETSLEILRNFEFVNGEPSMRIIEETDAEIAYRVKGDFVTSFELGRYPFDRHRIEVLIDILYATSEIDLQPETVINPDIMIVGWDFEGIEAKKIEHTYDGENMFPRYVLSLEIRRPLLSTILKNILPITIISAIALLTFLISVNNPSQRISLGVSTLLSATAFHLSLLGNIPPTGSFTIADGIMLSVYFLHFYSLFISVYLMRLKDVDDEIRAEKVNRKSILFLPFVLIIPILIAILFNR